MSGGSIVSKRGVVGMTAVVDCTYAVHPNTILEVLKRRRYVNLYCAHSLTGTHLVKYCNRYYSLEKHMHITFVAQAKSEQSFVIVQVSLPLRPM